MEKEKHGTGIDAAEASVAEGFFKGLGFTPEEVSQIKKQGFISRERRGNSIIAKLRFRSNGLQRTKYLGTDEQFVAEAQRHLERLQRVRALNQELRALNRQAARLLNASKERLKPFVEQAGLRFHGRAIRRPRTAGEQQCQN